jgi:hypothetical protein
MEKNKIIKYLREEINLDEAGKTPHIQHAIKPKTNDTISKDIEYDKIVKLLNNEIFNHAAIVRQLKGEPWAGNTEATNRSLFRKKLNKLNNDEGGTYSFSDETVADIQKILMNVSSTISHSIGRQGK